MLRCRFAVEGRRATGLNGKCTRRRGHASAIQAKASPMSTTNMYSPSQATRTKRRATNKHNKISIRAMSSSQATNSNEKARQPLRPSARCQNKMCKGSDTKDNSKRPRSNNTSTRPRQAN